MSDLDSRIQELTLEELNNNSTRLFFKEDVNIKDLLLIDGNLFPIYNISNKGFIKHKGIKIYEGDLLDFPLVSKRKYNGVIKLEKVQQNIPLPIVLQADKKEYVLKSFNSMYFLLPLGLLDKWDNMDLSKEELNTYRVELDNLRFIKTEDAQRLQIISNTT